MEQHHFKGFSEMIDWQAAIRLSAWLHMCFPYIFAPTYSLTLLENQLTSPHHHCSAGINITMHMTQLSGHSSWHLFSHHNLDQQHRVLDKALFFLAVPGSRLYHGYSRQLLDGVSKMCYLIPDIWDWLTWISLNMWESTASQRQWNLR